MHQLNPGSKFTITRQLEDPADTATYYVRAYIRMVDDDSLIATVNLTDKGEQRFRGEWYVPQYNVPTWITILTKVFTNSSYTTESMLYGRVEETFLIEQRWSHVFGGGGGIDISYKKIQEIIREEILKIKMPEIKTTNKTIIKKVEMNLTPILLAFGEIRKELELIKNRKEKDVNFAPVVNDIKQLGIMLDKAIKAQPQTDFSDILRALKEVSDIINRKNSELSADIKNIEINTKKPEKILEKPKRKFNLPFEIKERPAKRAFLL